MAAKALRLLVAAAATALLPMSAHANLITNGTFASPTCMSSTFCTYSGGSTAITNWTVTGNSVDLITGYWQAPPLGGNSVDLDGNGQGGVASTSFATQGGSQYILSFELSGNPDGTLGPHTVQVDIGGVTQDFTFNTATEQNSHSDMKWVAETLTFTAAASTTALSFTSLDPSGDEYGTVIGDVDVEAVPEPGTLALLGAGLFAMGLYGRRKLRTTV